MEKITKPRIIAVLQARFSSNRLPGKVLRSVSGKSLLQHQIERIFRSSRIDALIVATSSEPSDDQIAKISQQLGAKIFRGSLEDVLDRVYSAAKQESASVVIRLTADCPLIDSEIIDAIVDKHLTEKNDYTSNTIVPSFPDGLDVEVCEFSALKRAWREAHLPSEREHVTPYIKNNPDKFRLANYSSPIDHSNLRWTIDEEKDAAFIEHVYNEIYPENPNFLMKDVLALLNRRPELLQINSGIQRNTGLAKSVAKDPSGGRYSKSEAFLARACRSIPLGSQTFSKSKTQFPHGVSPYFISRAKGSRAWDIDGNEYVDFISALSSITLGHCDPDVTKAVQNQIQDGTIFSLPHPLETLVAEKIIDMVPCAEKVRFGKNGSDATSGAIRVARAFTARDRVAVCGYHGWQDWYIGSTARNRGVPKATSALTHTFEYNNIESLHGLLRKHPGEFAAVIMEPMNTTFPKSGFLEEVKALANREGALLIFDETITGFRFAKGGAQEYFGVTPDLATFGKGLANGYPLSAVAGRADVMALMEEIFFSFTFGGEALSLAASMATLEKLERHDVVAHLKATGERVTNIIGSAIKEQGVESALKVAGHPAWTFLVFSDVKQMSQWELKTLFLQEAFAAGILTFGTHNISFAHSEEDLKMLSAAYTRAFKAVRSAIDSNSTKGLLHTKVLEPLFKVR